MDVQGQPAIGAVVVDAGTTPVGAVSGLGLNPATGRSDWLIVRLSTGGSTAVPSYAASLTADGRLAVPFSLADLRAAPEVDSGVLTDDVAAALLRHFGLTS